MAQSNTIYSNKIKDTKQDNKINYSTSISDIKEKGKLKYFITHLIQNPSYITVVFKSCIEQSNLYMRCNKTLT